MPTLSFLLLAVDVLRHLGKGSALSFRANAEILGIVSKLSERLKKTEELRDIVESELFTSLLPFETDDAVESFFQVTLIELCLNFV